jgi:hypothetical protein
MITHETRPNQHLMTIWEFSSVDGRQKTLVARPPCPSCEQYQNEWNRVVGQVFVHPGECAVKRWMHRYALNCNVFEGQA